MKKSEFEELVKDGVEAIPTKFRALIENVAFLVDEEPSDEQCRQNRLAPEETLFGLYEGIPRPARGETYGGLVLPDRITIFQKPIEAEANLLAEELDSFRLRPQLKAKNAFKEEVRRIVSDTVWHEVAHHFGLDEGAVLKREEERGVQN